MTIVYPKNSNNVTKSESKVLEFIETKKDEFVFMTINEVAEALNVSDATVSRLARKVGCEDFKDLKNYVANREMSIGASKKMSNVIEEEGLSLKNYLLKQQEYMNTTIDLTDVNEFNKAVKLICTCRKVWLFGRKASEYLAELLNFRLSRMGVSCQSLSSARSEFVEKLAFIGQDDVVIFFSFSKLSWEAKVILDYQKERKYKTIGFTSKLHAPDDEKADINLYVYRGPEDEYHSQASPIAYLDALVVKVFEKLGNRSIESLENVKKLKDSYKNFK